MKFLVVINVDKQDPSIKLSFVKIK